jgi:hypothetical protein
MPSSWLARLFFGVVAVIALAGVLTGTACTRWGTTTPATPTLAPLSQIFVNPAIGSDTTGNGSMNKPYKTFTKALQVLVSAKSISTSGVTITLSRGDYNAANGERFPLVVPEDVKIDGSSFGGGPSSGTFIDGSGEDTIFEELVHAPAHSAYTTLEIESPASVSVNDLYVGASTLKLPGSHAIYNALDVLGTLGAGTSALGAGIVSSSPNVSGVLVAGGTFSCDSCEIHGNYYGVGGISVPVATASPGSVTPSVTLTQSTSDSTIVAKVADILTDGSTDVTASEEHFEKGEYAFSDALRPVVYAPVRGAVDFGGGGGSTGGNVFLGARIAEISIVRRSETVTALDDTWNPNQQQANHGGLYTKKIVFGPGADGKNVKILHDAVGSTVTVGPASVPTPSASPSATPSSSPTPF